MTYRGAQTLRETPFGIPGPTQDKIPIFHCKGVPEGEATNAAIPLAMKQLRLGSENATRPHRKTSKYW